LTAELCEFKFDSELASFEYRLRGVMAEHGKAIVYKIFFMVDQLPYNIYTINSIGGENVSNGCGFYEAQNDAGTKRLNNPELTSINQQCLICNVKLSRFINYIGSLQELCQARSWDLPKYEYSRGIKGISKNQKHFYTVKCSAGPYVSEGIGKNKKMAKKQAAKILLKYWVNVL